MKPGKPNTSEYVPIDLEMIPLNAPLPCDVFANLGADYFKAVERGDRLNFDRYTSIRNLTRGTVFIHRLTWQFFLAEIEQQQLAHEERDGSSGGGLRDLLVAYGRALHHKLREPKRPAFEQIARGAFKLAQIIERYPSRASGLIRRREDPILYYVNHSTNVAVYSVVLGLKLNLPMESLKLLCYGALVHDVGNLYLPSDTLFNLDEVKQQNQSEFRMHTMKGDELLQSVGAPHEVMAIALQHHERWDGAGYPSGLREDAIHPLARICAVADSLDDLTTARPGHARVGYDEAIRSLQNESGKHDPDLVAQLNVALVPFLEGT